MGRLRASRVAASGLTASSTRFPLPGHKRFVRPDVDAPTITVLQDDRSLLDKRFSSGSNVDFLRELSRTESAEMSAGRILTTKPHECKRACLSHPKSVSSHVVQRLPSQRARALQQDTRCSRIMTCEGSRRTLLEDRCFSSDRTFSCAARALTMFKQLRLWPRCSRWRPSCLLAVVT